MSLICLFDTRWLYYAFQKSGALSHLSFGWQPQWYFQHMLYLPALPICLQSALQLGRALNILDYCASFDWPTYGFQGNTFRHVFMRIRIHLEPSCVSERRAMPNLNSEQRRALPL